MPSQYFATVARGLEKVAAQELKNLNAKNIEITFAGIYFQGDKSLLYRVNIWSRTILREITRRYAQKVNSHHKNFFISLSARKKFCKMI